MTLDEILAGLQKSAADNSDEDKSKDEKSKDEKSKEDEGKGKDDSNPFDKKSKEEKEETQEKKASFKSGEDLAKEIMEKVASTKIENTKGEEMNKQASDAGKALAQALLTKLAGLGDVSTENGIPDGVVPNKTQVDIAAQRAEHDNSFQPTPGTDGAGNGGTINQIFDAIVADAQARTGAVTMGQSASAPAEGAINGQAPNQEVVDESQEKMAAAISLVNSGMDFDSAVELVKAASDELELEHEEQVKQAAFGELMEAGVDFDLAVAMVKEASRLTAAKQAVGNALGAAHAYGYAAKESIKATGQNIANRVSRAYNGAATKANAKIQAATGVDSYKGLYNKAATKANAKIQAATGATSYGELGQNIKNHVARNKLAYGAGAAGVGAAGAGAAYMSREKKAALDQLLDDGFDFDTAVEAIQSL